MATLATTAPPTNATDAEFRQWINVWHSLFTQTGGWVQTGDTGQINFATAARPGAANTKVGYAIYRMDDALQATKPVILKLAFGSGSAQNTPGVWFAIGTKTDGAGNFVDGDDADRAAELFDQYSQTAPAIFPAGNQTTLRECFGSVSTDRFVIYMFEAKPAISDTPDGTCGNIAVTANDSIGAEGNYPMLFSIERSRDWAGATTGEGVMVAWSQPSNPRVQHFIYLNIDHSLPPLTHTQGAVFVLPHVAAAVSEALEYHDSMLVANAPATSPIFFKRSTYPMPPGVNLMTGRHPRFKFSMDTSPCVTHDGAYLTGRTIAIAPYGTTRTYRTCAGMRMGNYTANGQDSSAFVYILYE